MAQSVKISDEVMKIVRRESELQSRSVAGQITYWLRIGRVIERSGHFDHARLSAALTGELETRDLGEEEKDVWLDAFVGKMGQPAPSEEAFFEKRRRLGQGVGLDDSGKLVYEHEPAAA
ncbi:TA system antitoxin ParD family protein [Pacificimonas flava]|uniref:ParD-like antitoxin of type II toxin-antitoxin system n=1 Tax=Pacificimonas flava TaxID=1234595 RepID=M2T5B2_9SPHN|nr:hypothetical protein [Pacificimonas flava]EMD81679.1 hypothetical protein C725_2963 [Pacificimonas flava]MBB5281773.1 hypothetical protein [Pacificimonas flava]